MKMEVCPRCGEPHGLTPKRLKRPIVDPEPADKKRPCTYHYWAMCPNAEEPVLFAEHRLDDVLILAPAPEREAVEKLAYRIWEQVGKPEGRDVECWLLAEHALTGYYRIPSSTRMAEEVAPDLWRGLLSSTAKKLAAWNDSKIAGMFVEIGARQ